MIKVVIHESELDDKWYVAFKGGNNEIWFTSEGYESKENADRSVNDFISQMTNQAGFHILTVDRGGYEMERNYFDG